MVTSHVTQPKHLMILFGVLNVTIQVNQVQFKVFHQFLINT